MSTDFATYASEPNRVRLRLDNRYDGTAETQRPLPIGEGFTYRLSFQIPASPACSLVERPA